MLYKTEVLPPKIRQRCLLSLPLINIVLEILATAFKQESEIKASEVYVCTMGAGVKRGKSSWLASLLLLQLGNLWPRKDQIIEMQVLDYWYCLSPWCFYPLLPSSKSYTSHSCSLSLLVATLSLIGRHGVMSKRTIPYTSVWPPFGG